MNIFSGIAEPAKFLLEAWDKGKGGKAVIILGGLTLVGTGIWMFGNWWTNHLKKSSGSKKDKEKQQAKAGLDEWLQNFKQAHRKEANVTPTIRTLIYNWLIEGYDTGLLAPTDCGKTTYVLQVAMDLAAGHCAYPLARQCEDCKPMRVVVFSLEQSDLEIKTYYGDMLEKLQPMLTIYAGREGNTPDKMIEKIKAELMASGKGGVVVIIDNFTTMLEISDRKEVKQFCLDLNTIRQASTKTDKPLTLIKVFHAKKDCKLDRRFDQNCFRGDVKYLYDAQNVLYLTYCRKGDDWRVQGYIKRKNGDRLELNLLRFANTLPHRFLLDKLGRVEDLGKPEEKQQEREGKKVGRPSDFSDRQMENWYADVQAGTTSYKELEEKYGVTRDAIKQRRYNIRKREERNGNKLFPKDGIKQLQYAVLQQHTTSKGSAHPFVTNPA